MERNSARPSSSVRAARARPLPSLAFAISFVLGSVAVLSPRVAAAQGLKVAVLSIDGPHGEKATREIVKAVRGTGDELVTEVEWNGSAQKLFATSRSAGDLAAVAGDLGVQVVVTGKVKKTEDGWQLSVSVRHGPTGKSAVKLKYALRGPRLDPATLRRLAEEIPPALDTAAAGPPASETPETNEVPATPGETDKEESPLANANAPDVRYARRPSWTPYVEGTFSFALAGRSFAFDSPDGPSFKGTVAPGIEIGATVFPLAFLGERNTARDNALAGLGLGFTYGADFWPDSVPCHLDSTGACSSTVDRFATHEWRWDIALKWRWNIKRAAESWPQLLAELGYGEHAFNIQQREYLSDIPQGSAGNMPAPVDVGPPNVDYQFVKIGVGTRVPFAKRFAFQLLFDWHVVASAGAIQTDAEWGKGGAYGFSLRGGFDVNVWQGLFVRVHALVEYYGLSFDQPRTLNGKPLLNTKSPCPCAVPNGGASDAYYGGLLGVGYAY